jgi:pimeloyl-ACP methyl ester carboxylesterase
MPVTTGNPVDATPIRPFAIPKVPDGELKALRARIAATRWPDQETVTDDSQGVPLAMVQELASYWAADYDWRRCEAKLNALPHFVTEIDGLDWMLDHDTDSYYKITRAFVEGHPSGGLTRDHVLDNITAYWLTGTGASAARSYWEGGRAQVIAAGQARPEVKLPVGFTTFPDEIFRAPRSWVQKAYPNLSYFHEADRGGHFAAWEEPELFATEIRAAFTSLR